jgi:hypothetical protein
MPQRRHFDGTEKMAILRERVRHAAAGGAILTNGRERREMRLEPGQLAAWRLLARDRDLDAEERDAAA